MVHAVHVLTNRIQKGVVPLKKKEVIRIMFYTMVQSVTVLFMPRSIISLKVKLSTNQISCTHQNATVKIINHAFTSICS